LRKTKTFWPDTRNNSLYVLVDEYRDTSGTQNRLVELLINYWEKPNVFVVGDDDKVYIASREPTWRI
jgi:superfamily I DNA/RNA helicase